jgi:hypothetical protein
MFLPHVKFPQLIKLGYYVISVVEIDPRVGKFLYLFAIKQFPNFLDWKSEDQLFDNGGIFSDRGSIFYSSLNHQPKRTLFQFLPVLEIFFPFGKSPASRWALSFISSA